MPHQHHHSTPTEMNHRFQLAILLNLVFVAIEVYFGWQANSLALLADAGHNLSDVAGLLLAWLGIWATRWKSNDKHTYGWQKLSIMASLVNAIILISAMIYLTYEAISRNQHEHQLQGETMVWVATAGIVINALTAWLFLKDSHHDLNMRAAFLHMSADALVSLGVVISGLLVLWLGFTWIDSLMSLIIAGVVLAATWSVFTQSLHLSFDGVPSRISLNEVKQCLLAVPGVVALHDLHIWAMSTRSNALSVHLVIEEKEHYDSVLTKAKDQLHELFDLHQITIQIESKTYAQHCEQNHLVN
ncbi:MAG: cation transporter [Thiotrichales bacterium 34-46-19]|nr:MAG: cation transporter [Thiotrichales bacterium 34-46-19]